jgi:hypothetical protein
MYLKNVIERTTNKALKFAPFAALIRRDAQKTRARFVGVGMTLSVNRNELIPGVSQP